MTPSVSSRLRGRLATSRAASASTPGEQGGGTGAVASLGASSQVKADEVAVSWRPSRHARRLLTLAAAALLLAVLTRNAALAGVAGPPLLLLGMARAGAGRGSGRGPGRPDRVSVRIGLTATRVYEGEPAAVDVTVQDGPARTPRPRPPPPLPQAQCPRAVQGRPSPASALTPGTASGGRSSLARASSRAAPPP